MCSIPVWQCQDPVVLPFSAPCALKSYEECQLNFLLVFAGSLYRNLFFQTIIRIMAALSVAARGNPPARFFRRPHSRFRASRHPAAFLHTRRRSTTTTNSAYRRTRVSTWHRLVFRKFRVWVNFFGQSPGRDSPGSSSGSAGSGSRHSTASLDSGRASYHPLSTAGRSTIGSSNSPRCSLSSCSIGSEQGRIERMIHQGVPVSRDWLVVTVGDWDCWQDQEIIHAWLVDLQYDEYFQLFVNAGYDLPTIGRMTPEDLTAIGIKKPNHRKRLKAEIAQLNLPDNLPEFIPVSRRTMFSHQV